MCTRRRPCDRAAVSRPVQTRRRRRVPPSAPRYSARHAAPDLMDLLRVLPRLAEMPEQSDPDTGGSRLGIVWSDVRLVAVGIGGTGDVEVDPRHIADEFLEEQSGGNRSGASTPGVAYVSHRRLDLFRVDLPQRQLPAAVTGPFASRQ